MEQQQELQQQYQLLQASRFDEMLQVQQQLQHEISMLQQQQQQEQQQQLVMYGTRFEVLEFDGRLRADSVPGISPDSLGMQSARMHA